MIVKCRWCGTEQKNPRPFRDVTLDNKTWYRCEKCGVVCRFPETVDRQDETKLGGDLVEAENAGKQVIHHSDDNSSQIIRREITLKGIVGWVIFVFGMLGILYKVVVSLSDGFFGVKDAVEMIPWILPIVVGWKLAHTKIRIQSK